MFDGYTKQLDTSGWCAIPGAFPSTLTTVVARELDKSLSLRETIRRDNGVEGKNDGTVHHLLGDHAVFVELLEMYEQFDPLLRSFFSGNYILNSYGGVINRSDTDAYVHHIHRDIRFASDPKRFMLNSLVMLDDFTLENGATYVLSGSQTLPHRPDEPRFMAQADRATGSKGSII